MIEQTIGQKLVSVLFAFLAGMGATPDHAPLAAAIFLGLSLGTVAAWPKERVIRRVRKISTIRWWSERVMLWGALAMVVLGLQEIAEAMHLIIGARLAGGIAMVAAYMGPEVLDRLATRAGREIDTHGS